MQGPPQVLLEMNVSPNSLSLRGIPEGYSDCTPGGIRGKQGFNGEELDIV